MIKRIFNIKAVAFIMLYLLVSIVTTSCSKDDNAPEEDDDENCSQQASGTTISSTHTTHILRLATVLHILQTAMRRHISPEVISTQTIGAVTVKAAQRLYHASEGHRDVFIQVMYRYLIIIIF